METVKPLKWPHPIPGALSILDHIFGGECRRECDTHEYQEALYKQVREELGIEYEACSCCGQVLHNDANMQSNQRLFEEFSRRLDEVKNGNSTS